jgi:uncharacterized protein (DUF1330 family)
MSAYLVAHAAVKDMDKLKEYAGQAVPMIEAIGGERLFRGPVAQVLVGNNDANLCAAFRFPDRDTLQRWYDSDAYQALIPLRDAAADMTFLVVEDMPE